MRSLPRVPPALLALWSAYALAAALGYAAAFREPKRTAIVRSVPRETPTAVSATSGPREIELAEPARWAELAPSAQHAATFLPSGAPAFSAHEIAIGARLFLEPWAGGTQSCASCHEPAWGFGSGDGAVPPLLELGARAAYRGPAGWQALEERIARALVAPDELRASPGAAARAWRSFAAPQDEPTNPAEGAAANADDAAAVRALAIFLAVQRSGPAAFDRASTDAGAPLSELQQNGRQRFEGASGCSRCHPAPHFPVEGGSTLRDLELRPPYAAGRWRSLRELLEQHEASAPRSADELAALESFLRALGSERSFPFLPERAPALARPR